MTANSNPITTRSAAAADVPAISALSARVFGPGRFVRTAYRIREGTSDVSPFCRVALLGDRIIAAIRMTEVAVDSRAGALLLGPLAVDPEFANLGYGRRLIAESMDAGRAAGRELVLLVGDMPYYGRLGFVPVPPGQIALPGPVNPARLLAAELKPGALAHYRGLVAGLLE
jgi:predicted N-acetyltransferase YhbS